MTNWTANTCLQGSKLFRSDAQGQLALVYLGRSEDRIVDGALLENEQALVLVSRLFREPGKTPIRQSVLLLTQDEGAPITIYEGSREEERTEVTDIELDGRRLYIVLLGMPGVSYFSVTPVLLAYDLS